MKIKALTLAVAAASAFPVAAMAAGPIDGSVYGKVNVSMVNADDGSDDQWELNSNASRIGFKGKTKLSDNLYAIYKLEYETSVDDGEKDGQTFTQRNIMGGLTGGFGTIWAGKHDTPTKMAQNKIDLFNDLEGDLKNTFEGENRVNNIVAYTTPMLGDAISITVAGVFGEGDSGSKVGEVGDKNDGVDGTSVSINYETDNLYLALAADQDIDGQDLVRAVGQWKIENLQLGLMYQQSESNIDSDIKDEDGWFVSAAYKIDKVKLKAQYGKIEDDADGDEEETFSIGADYKLGDNTKLFAFYTENTDEDGGSSSEDENDYFGLGMEHKF
ncbi:MAG: porin [Porticoccaceae bacterium]|nr:porin [Pseudomonadales bacterium]MCP5171695.1 porin [Pseudomonadales bacterium]